jgi:tRNA (cmo5U34)-methyltransferase
LTTKRDQLFTKKSVTTGSFKFDGAVAEVFDDMISRSVPGYVQIISLLPTLSRRFAKENCRYYDLGCSTGAGLLAMAEGVNEFNSTLIGLDNSAAMIEQAKIFTAKIAIQENIDLQLSEADIISTPIDKAAMILMNFTLQFIPLDQRDALIDKIYDGLIPGGALVLSEKIKPSSPEVDQLLTTIHHQFKADQGYSDLEISKKRDAIENVLIPETLEAHKSRLQNAGFSIITPWISNLQFVSILAIK